MSAQPPTSGAGPDGGAVRVLACLDGFEPFVEAEALRARPGSVVAERRAGLVLVCDPGADASLSMLPPLGAAFARAEFTLWDEISDPRRERLADALAGSIVEALDPSGAPPALHVFAASMEARDERVEAAKRLEADLRRRLGARVAQRIAAAPGDDVIDVALASATTALLGAHRRTESMSAYPGGQRRLRAREDAPSRSHLKLEEGLEWAALPLTAGETAVDVGCSPGGWSFVLLEKGLLVHGIDPTPVADNVREHERFTHHRASVKEFRAAEARETRWVFCDMNGPPASALGLMAKLLPALPKVRGVLHTLKLSDDPPLETLDRGRAFFRGAGFSDVRVRHLYHNRHELTLVARR